VLRNKTTEEVYLVVNFTLYLRDDVNEDGSLKTGAGERATEEALGEDKKSEEKDKTQGEESKADDVD
jgi:hypothetical protein